ncbi:MAG: 30S ribosome-binding factor RbfA [Thermoanaerobaculia bacterium]
MSRRTERIEDQLRQELAELLLHRVHDPRIRGCTIAALHVSPDLQHARVSVSVLGSDEERGAAVVALEHAGGFLRAELAARMRHLRRIPALSFELDRGAEYSQRIADLLEDLQ